MTEREKIVDVFYRFEYEGLVTKNINKVLDCMADEVVGIGIGEQGYVTSREDVRRVFEDTLKNETPFTHSIRFGRVEVLQHSHNFATVCAEVIVDCNDEEDERISESRFFQLLTLIKSNEEWKICALHASTPIVTEESVEGYPLKIAEKTLKSLKEKMGEQAYQEEEKYRQAVLADTIAFYVINLDTGLVEKCQCDSDLCIVAQEGDVYERIVREGAGDYIHIEDYERMVEALSIDNIRRVFDSGENELKCEYRLQLRKGGYIWASTVMRSVVAVNTGYRKCIMYVRNIHEKKSEELALLNRASRDCMTGLYNRDVMMGMVNQILEKGAFGTLVMLDVDDFKDINDTYGHPMGDRVLIEIARIITVVLSEDSIAGRLGGDEFCAFVPAKNDGTLCVDEIQNMLLELRRIAIPDIPDLKVSCSVGAAHVRLGMDFNALYKKSDEALYSAKNAGKNRIVIL